MAEDDDLSYVVPKEGSVLWIDGLCIPKGAPHMDAAYDFINHVHDATVNAEIANNSIKAGAGNLKASAP